MRLATTTEGSNWLKTRGLSVISKMTLAEDLLCELTFRVPGDSGRKTALAREICGRLAGEQDELLLWISGYGIWPSSENQELFYAYRASFGERRSLLEAPCHVLQASDMVALECLLDLILYFSWDATIVNGRGDTAVSLSHDEILTVRTKDEAKRWPFEELLGRLGLDRVI